MKEINQILEHYYVAFHNQQWEELAAILSDDFTYFTDQCTIQNKEQFLNFMSGDVWKAESYKLSKVEVIASVGGDMALARYHTEFIGADNGKPLTVKAIETSIFHKEAPGYKMIHSHTSNKIEM